VIEIESFSEMHDLYRVATLEEQKFYETMLYPLQDIVFDVVQEYGSDLYLTGGTALARFHFSHRLSEDLDFFTTTDDLQVMANDLRLKLIQQGFEVETDRLTAYFARLYLLDKDVRLKIEFAKEFHLVDPLVQSDKQIYLNSLEDIGANKISAFEDRATIKDLIDLYYITQQISLPRLFELADMKRVPVAYEQLLTIHAIGLTGNAFLTRPLADETLAAFLQELVEETALEVKKKR